MLLYIGVQHTIVAYDIQETQLKGTILESKQLKWKSEEKVLSCARVFTVMSHLFPGIYKKCNCDITLEFWVSFTGSAFENYAYELEILYNSIV